MTKKKKDDTWYNEICEREIVQSQADDDAAGLRKAMKGFGTNEKRINAILIDKSKAEIQAIRAAFQNNEGRDLIKDIKKETRGKYEKILVALLYAADEYDAKLIRDAVEGLGTDEGLLSEVLATRTPEEIIAMAKVYEKNHDNDMITDIEKDTSGNFQKICCLLMKKRRPMGSDVDGDVEKLYKAGAKKIGTDEGVFIRMLAGYSRSYVEKLYWAYAEKYGKALDRVVRSEFSGRLEKILVALCTPVEIYMSEKIRKAMKGVGTDDNDLTRLIATMKERYLRKIGAHFLKNNGKALWKAVDNETSGDYGKVMVGTVKAWGSN